jgi:protein-L-isoaspartate O-methyltransferase
VTKEVIATAPPSWTELVKDLTAKGVLEEPWRSAFLAVPREVFIPDVLWRRDRDGLVRLHRAEDPEEWLRRAYGPGYVITQVDDGSPIGPNGRGEMPTSSASRPDIVALMLAAGQLEPGMRVLEIGTGTGYTAALLAHYLGAGNVTTIEVDPILAARARAALATAGYEEVTVITDDGARGHSEGAPFDRVLSTVAAPRVPYEWVAQTRPGGLIVTPWGSAYKHAGLLSLTVHPDGSATGGLVNTTIAFMQLRDQRIPWPEITEVVRDTDTPEVTDTDVHASKVCNDGGAPFAIALQVPSCHREFIPATEEDGCWCVWFLDAGTRSWARFDYVPETRRWPVHQFGPRRLWDEITAAYRHWEDLGRPAATSWRFTITPDQQRVELP